MNKWLVDLGDHTEIWNTRKLNRYYTKEINHTEYKNFEDWLSDMTRMALVTAII